MIEGIDLPFPEPADEPLSWLAFDKPRLPEDPETVHEFMGAQSCSNYLTGLVKGALKHDVPITAQHITDYYEEWHDNWLERHQSESIDYTLTHVLGATKRFLLELESLEEFGDDYQAAVATHDLIEEALRLERGNDGAGTPA